MGNHLQLFKERMFFFNRCFKTPGGAWSHERRGCGSQNHGAIGIVICWRSLAGKFPLNHHLRNSFWFTFYSGRKVAKSRFLLGNLQLPPRQMRKIRKLLTLPKEKSIFSRECLGFHKVWCDVFSFKHLHPWNASGMDSTRSETVLH